MNSLHYVGEELDVFAHALHWKRYWSSCVRPFISGDVLEVGAGIGANTPLLISKAVRSWVSLEPDARLAARASSSLAADVTTADCKVVVGTTTAMLEEDARFDVLLYIDVLEHIEGDTEELGRAAQLLKSGGRVVVLSPAHPWLFTPFDKGIGHFRRYNRQSLLACSPQGCELTRLWYLDAVGMLASCGNRLLLQQSMPKLEQILFWDRYLVPPSQWLDPILQHRVGKSILGIWTKL